MLFITPGNNCTVLKGGACVEIRLKSLNKPAGSPSVTPIFARNFCVFFYLDFIAGLRAIFSFVIGCTGIQTRGCIG